MHIQDHCLQSLPSGTLLLPDTSLDLHVHGACRRSAPAPRQSGDAGGSVQEASTVSGCIACGLSAKQADFGGQAEQREHFKSDWHRVNVKRRQGGRPPLSEDDFEQLISRGGDEVPSHISDVQTCNSQHTVATAGPESEVMTSLDCHSAMCTFAVSQVSSISGSSSSEDEDDAEREHGGSRERGGLPQEHFVTSGKSASSLRGLSRTSGHWHVCRSSCFPLAFWLTCYFIALFDLFPHHALLAPTACRWSSSCGVAQPDLASCISASELAASAPDSRAAEVHVIDDHPMCK